MESRVRADRGHAHPGAVPLTIPTPFGPAMLEATSFRDHGDAAEGGEDAVRGGALLPSLRGGLEARGRSRVWLPH
jgi:hypothetical protein